MSLVEFNSYERIQKNWSNIEFVGVIQMENAIWNPKYENHKDGTIAHNSKKKKKCHPEERTEAKFYHTISNKLF